MKEVFQQFHPLLLGIAAVAQGDDSPRAALLPLLAKLRQDGWHIDAAVHALWAGERDLARLTAGLAEADQQLLGRILQLVQEQEGAE